MKTNNPFIAAACDQAGEVYELVQPPQQIAQPVAVASDADWLYVKLMDWCRKTGRAPANENKLFAIVEELRKLLAAAQPVEPSSGWAKGLEIRMSQGWKLKGGICPVLYTDTINGEGVGRDDLWLATTAALATEQHASDSKELRRLCQERDDLRRANSLHKVDIAALESSVGHLSTLVDELRRLLGAAMQTMTDLHESATPDESTADIDAHIPGAAFAKFVNEHAQLLFEIKNGCAAAPAPTLPAAAVAEGAQLDGESLEPSE